MSQRHVEGFIGRLATDRELRSAFSFSPADALAKFKAEGYELGSVETTALLELDVDALARFAETLDARLRRLGQSGTFNLEDINKRRSS